MLRQRLFRLSALVPVIGGLLVLIFTALPSSTAFACLPCNCPDLTSVNCFGPYALYTSTTKAGDCSIDIWIIENGQGKRALELDSADLADLPDAEDIDGYILADDAFNGYVSLYKLQGGEYQINVGPDGEGKVYVIDFTGCPAENVTESTFVAGQ